jgi:hypothetical protein
MVQAAERSLRALVRDPALDVWYVGNAPVGHWLQVYGPEQQKATGCYGAKVFFYRAEILRGRFRLPKAGAPDAAAFPYDDYYWLARDETEPLLARPMYKYVHQILGAGAGEEAARSAAWQAKISAKGLTPAQATGRRAHRVAAQRGEAVRLPAVATRAQAQAAALPWSGAGAAAPAAGAGGGKAGALKGEVSSYYQRLTAQKALSAQAAAQLATPSAAAAAASKLSAARAAVSAAGGTGGRVAAAAQ